MATDEEKVQIATQFLLASPPGEFNEVVTDVRTLVDNDAILNRTALSTFKTYNEKQMIAVAVPDSDYKVLVTSHGALDTKLYRDPIGKQVLVIDHVKQICSGLGDPLEVAEDVEALRATVDEQVQAYVKNYFPTGTATVYGAKEGSAIKITACISAARFNSNNFWNGRWRSTWSVTVKGSDGKVSGSMAATVHIFEDGNVQLNTSHSKTGGVKGGDAAALATAFVALVEKEEGAYQAALTMNHHTMEKTTFKALRRNLPITQTKMDFDKLVNANKALSEMHGSKA